MTNWNYVLRLAVVAAVALPCCLGGCVRPSPEVCRQERNHGINFATSQFKKREAASPDGIKVLQDCIRTTESHRKHNRDFANAVIKKRVERDHVPLQAPPPAPKE